MFRLQYGSQRIIRSVSKKPKKAWFDAWRSQLSASLSRWFCPQEKQRNLIVTGMESGRKSPCLVKAPKTHYTQKWIKIHHYAKVSLFKSMNHHSLCLRRSRFWFESLLKGQELEDLSCDMLCQSRLFETGISWPQPVPSETSGLKHLRMNTVCICFSFKTFHQKPMAERSKIIDRKSSESTSAGPDTLFISPFVGNCQARLLQQSDTLPETNSSPLKIDAWNTILSYWDDLFSGANLLLVSGRVKITCRSFLIIDHRLVGWP